MRIGDVAVISGEPVELPNGRVVSRAMDNRLGCFVALEAARLVSEAGGAPGEVAAVAAAQEEITFAGATTSAYWLQPDVAIVVDVTFATDAPGIEVKEIGKHPFGSGPTIHRGSTLHPKVFELLHDTAEAEGIPFTLAASARFTGTDADAIHLNRAGVPTGVVSMPLRYMHSPVEMVQLDDVENTARLIAAFARRLEPGTSFERELAAAAAVGHRRHAAAGAYVAHRARCTRRSRACTVREPRRRDRVRRAHRRRRSPRDLLRIAGVSGGRIDERAGASGRRRGDVRAALPGRSLRFVAPGVRDVLRRSRGATG